MAKALELANLEKDAQVKRLEELKDFFENQVFKNIPRTLIVGKRAERSPAISSLIFADIEAPIVVMNLDLAGIAVSAGAASSSGMC